MRMLLLLVESFISMLGFVHLGLVRVLHRHDEDNNYYEVNISCVHMDLVYVLVRHGEEMT